MSYMVDALKKWNKAMGESTPEQWTERIVEERCELAKELADVLFVETGYEVACGRDGIPIHRLDLFRAFASIFGIDMDMAFELVAAANMSKLGRDGKPIRRPSDGKVMKGPRYCPPDMSIAITPPTIRMRTYDGKVSCPVS